MLSLRNAVQKQMVAERFRNVEIENHRVPKIDDFAGARTSSLYTRKREACQLIGRVPIFGEWTKLGLVSRIHTLFGSLPSTRLAKDMRSFF